MPPFPPRQRLASISGGGQRGRVDRSRPKKAAARRECPQCKSTDLQDYDGALVCADCGNTLDESNIVAEVTFGESSAGAAVVQGGAVAEGARHATTLGPAFRRAGGGMESREMTENQGKDEIRRQANNLNLPDHVADQAFSIYKLACNANFIQGRRVNIVASCCLYVACRRDKENTTMLMDFSEAISVNVFKVGQTYQDLKKTLVLPDSNPLGIRPVIDVEHLVLKFAKKLEFGNQVYKVADDACKILKRMKRDWMVTGRRPAGLCGACIILAARMNNFRRTVREVVFVVKVADMTVAKRLEEFGRTQASQLSVDQFREVGVRLKVTHDPPIMYQTKLKEERKNSKRKRKEMLDGDGEEVSINGDARSESGTPAPTAEASQNRRTDADGFAIPALPIDPNLTQLADAVSSMREASAPVDAEEGEPAPKKRKPGRPRNEDREPLPEITEADLVAEEELEEEMEEILADPTSLASMESAAFTESETRAKDLAVSLRNPVTTTPKMPVSQSTEIDENEFENDPEVRNCLLSDMERKIKERIWVTHNEDWLRAQQAKMLKKALDEANGIAGKPKRKRSDKGRMGDGTLLEGGTPVESPADANQRMLERRAKTFSKHINYEKLNKFYAGLRGQKGGPGSTTATETDQTTNTESEPAEAENENAAATGNTGKAVAGARSGMVTPEATQQTPSKAGAPGDEDGGRDSDAEWEENEAEEEDVDVDEDEVLQDAGVDIGGFEDDYAGYGYDGEGDD